MVVTKKAIKVVLEVQNSSEEKLLLRLQCLRVFQTNYSLFEQTKSESLYWKQHATYATYACYLWPLILTEGIAFVVSPAFRPLFTRLNNYLSVQRIFRKQIVPHFRFWRFPFSSAETRLPVRTNHWFALLHNSELYFDNKQDEMLSILVYEFHNNFLKKFPKVS